MRKRDVELNTYVGTNCPQVAMLSNGKNRMTLAGNVEQVFRLIQSIPSPKAEPFKQWLAKVGYERLQEIQDPSLSMDRARENWKSKGRSEKWIQQRWLEIFRTRNTMIMSGWRPTIILQSYTATILLDYSAVSI